MAKWGVGAQISGDESSNFGLSELHCMQAEELVDTWLLYPSTGMNWWRGSIAYIQIYVAPFLDQDNTSPSSKLSTHRRIYGRSQPYCTSAASHLVFLAAVPG